MIKNQKFIKRKRFIVIAVAILLMVNLFSQENKSFLISDGSEFIAKDYFPEFSWDSTPQYFMFGDIERVLFPEEVRNISSKTNFICIEKSHGFRELGAAELGAKREVAAFKKLKPETKVLFYFNSAYAWPFTSYNQNFTPEKINEHPELKKLLVTDPKTGNLAYRDHYIRHVYFFDVLNPDLREWWVDTVVKGMKVTGSDGVFVDQMHGFFWLRMDKKEEVLKAQGEMLAMLRKRMGKDKILLGNNAATEIARYVYPSIDATMFEHHNAQLISKENLLKEWDDMLKIARDGKMCVFRFGVGVEGNGPESGNKEEKYEAFTKLSRERLEFFLACYLIGAQPYSYFQYGWGWDLDSGSLVDHPELFRPLGAPKGAYKRSTPDGWEFTREFEHANVWLDTDKREAKITWH